MTTEEKQVREKILDAADARFRQYGYTKAGMAEIAADCDMSAANLYRYFENKKAIGEAICMRCLKEQADLIKGVTRDRTTSAAEKIRRFFRAALDYNYRQMADEPRLLELAQTVAAENQELIREHKLERMTSLVAEILAEGNRSGEFAVDDTVATARTVLMAAFAFHTPFLVITGVFPKPELDRMAAEVATLVIEGLRAR